MDNLSSLGQPTERSHGTSAQTNGSGQRRPQTIMSSSCDRKLISPPQNLLLTIHKDANGYGMKVSGDTPVYVESVKANGAAQKAGLIEGDMILKVNGTNVRYSTHTTVVHLIKSSTIVELTVQRNCKMPQRPASVSVGPSTPLAQRGGITAPVPVDSATSHELKRRKIETLHTFLEKEKKNLENLKSNNRNDNLRAEIVKVEQTIKTVQHQLQMQCSEVPPLHLFSPISQSHHHHQNIHSPTPQQPLLHVPVQNLPVPTPAPPSTPAFLSRFPRSLSSLSLGTKKKPNDKENLVSTSVAIIPTVASPIATSSSICPQISSPNSEFYNANIPETITSGAHHHHPHHQAGGGGGTPSKKKSYYGGLNKESSSVQPSDIPPPLPQRNIPRKDSDVDAEVTLRRSIQISDLDQFQNSNNNNAASTKNSTNIFSSTNSGSGGGAGKGKHRSKQPKIKALSDPKMSSQMFIDMEQQSVATAQLCDATPPPLPPRQPGMIEEKQNLLNNNKFGTNYGNRPPPNSLETLLSYPLTTTTQAVQDNFAAFPLSHRPNVQQILQQQSYNHHHHHQHYHHQQQLQSPNSTTATTAATLLSKSTALGLTTQQLNKFNNPQHRRAVSSPAHYPESTEQITDDRGHKSASGSWEVFENLLPSDGTPPPRYSPTPTNQLDESMTDSIFEIPPPSYPTNVAVRQPMAAISGSNVAQQRQIISMEDDEIADDQDSISEDHGPFRSLPQLLEPVNIAYLSVFLNFVITNSNPSPLLFYLITGLYKDGTIKDMRKWAYEIHSTFLVPRAPLLWCGIHESETLARDVDNVLQNEYHKGEILRTIFRKSRQRAKEHINQQIDEFKLKRTAGLGQMYGPSDQQLFEAKGDKVKEQKVFDETLMPKLQQLVDELEKEAPNECPKKSALSSALSTVLHRIFVTRSNPGSPIDRVHHFVSREKSFKSRLMGKTRKAMVRGHHLVLRQYYEVAHCNHCQNIIWGVSPQGYQCTDCELNIHRACSKVLEENCPGPASTKQKGQHTDKMSKFIEKIRPTHYFVQQERQRRLDEEYAADELSPDRPTTSVVRQPSDRRPEGGNNAAHGQTTGELTQSHSIDTDSNTQDAEPESRDSSKSKSAPVSVNRSESYKERLSHRRNRNNRRKTSDPSLSKTNDEHTELGISNANFTASSSSSLSSSPSTSLEAVGAPTAGQGTIPAPRQWVDSEDEAGDLEADWSSNVPADMLQTLSKGEKERQEIINEIYQTERNHVRTLKLLEGIFLRPLQESGSLNTEHLNLLFPPALLRLKDHHQLFEQQLKQRRIEHDSIVSSIGDLLLAMFDGRSGEDLKEHAAQFCARQQIALEALKEKRRKDENLQRLLSKAESHKACRRLQLKDLLPTALQRLTKYPLLFESLLTITQKVDPDNDTEAHAILKALDLSKRILDYVNQAVRIAEDAHKLQAIQKKLDRANYDKEAPVEFKNLDLTQHKLIHDGPLISKKNPGIQIHGLLFEDIMVLLHKLDDKYILRNYTYTAGEGGKNLEGRFNPISKINLILVRNSAVDKNIFFLINTSSSQMIDLTAPSSSDCKKWVKHISDAAEAFKSRTKGGSHEHADDASGSHTILHSSSKETPEGTPDKELPPTTIASVSEQSNLSVNRNTADSTKDAANINSSELNNNADLSCRKQSQDDDADNQVDTDDDEDVSKHDTEHDDNTDANRNHKREYSTNSNNTRTLTQQSSLVAPSEVHVSVSPALTAEPVLTPNERLRRLDESIRLTLAEKQKVVCDMFKVPNEHFTAIADIVGQPEAPKDPSDIVLAAFAQVQSLTETLNEYIRVSAHQEISAVSTSLCDECHRNSQQIRTSRIRHSDSSNSTSQATVASATTISAIPTDISASSAVTFATVVRSNVAPNSPPSSMVDGTSEDTVIVDDDGYCEIDELRLPTVLASAGASTFPIPCATSPTNTTITSAAAGSTPELKRQSTISADSIPEETEHEIHAELISASTITSEAEDGAVGADEMSHIEINDTYDTTSQQISQCNSESFSVDQQITTILATTGKAELASTLNYFELVCGPNRLAHVTSIAPAVPCHLISNYVTTLSLQISQLLPKLNERDIEREKLRKENQHLRELLNEMHERERVSSIKETPEHVSEETHSISENQSQQQHHQSNATD